MRTAWMLRKGSAAPGASAAVEVQPQAVVADTVVPRQDVGHGGQWRRRVPHPPVLRGQPWLQERPIEEAPVMLLPGDVGPQTLEERIGSRQPEGHDLHP